MSTDAESVAPYDVTYSDRVREKIQELASVARLRGDGREFALAVMEFHRRLCIYPQFGDPLLDLREHPGQIRVGIVPPFAMRYAVFEERRMVVAAALPVLLRRWDPAEPA